MCERGGGALRSTTGRWYAADYNSPSDYETSTHISSLDRNDTLFSDSAGLVGLDRSHHGRRPRSLTIDRAAKYPVLDLKIKSLTVSNLPGFGGQDDATESHYDESGQDESSQCSAEA